MGSTQGSLAGALAVRYIQAMRPSLFDWIVRGSALVLALMVALSLFAALSVLPSAGIGSFPAPARQERLEPSPAEETAATPGNRNDAQALGARAAGEGVKSEVSGAVGALATRLSTGDGRQWLPVIAYALLGLLCVAMLGVLLLARVLRQLRRIADAAERR